MRGNVTLFLKNLFTLVVEKVEHSKEIRHWVSTFTLEDLLQLQIQIKKTHRCYFLSFFFAELYPISLGKKWLNNKTGNNNF